MPYFADLMPHAYTRLSGRVPLAACTPGLRTRSHRVPKTLAGKPPVAPGEHWTVHMCGRVARHCLAALLCGCVGGCASGWGTTRYRVLDDLTGGPIQGITVIPYADDIFGTPYENRHLTTDADGWAVAHYGTSGYNVEDETGRGFRLVHPHDRPGSRGDWQEIYMRRPARVILALPPGFTGPLLVAAPPRGTAQPRRAVYRLPLPADRWTPIQVPGLDTDAVELDELRAERGAAPLPRGTPDAAPGTVCLWTPRLYSGSSYEGELAEVLLVGTPQGFARFERVLDTHRDRLDYVKGLDRGLLANLNAAAEGSLRPSGGP